MIRQRASVVACVFQGLHAFCGVVENNANQGRKVGRKV